MRLFSKSKQTSQSTYKLIQDCHELKLDTFLRILFRQEYDLLLVSGSCSKEVVEAQWHKIYAQYVDLLDDPGQKDIYNCIKDIYIWKAKFERVEILVQLLSIGYYPPLVEELRKMGYSYAFDFENDLSGYKADLLAVYNRAKTLLVQINNRKKDLERLQVRSKGQEQGMADFDMTLIALSEHFKYSVRPSDITVSQYALMIKQVREYAMKLQAQTTPQQTKGTWQKN